MQAEAEHADIIFRGEKLQNDFRYVNLVHDPQCDYRRWLKFNFCVAMNAYILKLLSEEMDSSVNRGGYKSCWNKIRGMGWKV